MSQRLDCGFTPVANLVHVPHEVLSSFVGVCWAVRLNPDKQVLLPLRIADVDDPAASDRQLKGFDLWVRLPGLVVIDDRVRPGVQINRCSRVGDELPRLFCH